MVKLTALVLGTRTSSTTTRIKTLLHMGYQMGLMSTRTSSTTTRIKTAQSLTVPLLCTHVLEHLPLQQGLRQ